MRRAQTLPDDWLICKFPDSLTTPNLAKRAAAEHGL
jgi:hypothetical protein